ncbi:glucose PTS transporter transcription antiterminator GlcT [Amphibacillus xylanus]|uniref:Transcriptional antiterminator GlcT n=1 Tax=Amphibacillus xylanus (strain ATCC 51415 / DSM 6626 / JCM 7361 / LMG 17667 / NBRC 15112 / Ep01) TaxID=698758 RepID=K0J6S0_AMPXN|nr:PRD domain-containing protein [Amphibacillus xylanus]BAM46838.1 transcriptional antiterminator GlcT [Amphibacillus xylanus NBRC 15112]
MEKEIRVKQALNNNVVIAKGPLLEEVVLIGKGIGFNRKKGDTISVSEAEKTFVLTDKIEIEQYQTLIKHQDPALIEFLNDIIFYIEAQMDRPLNEHIHIALTDHLSFAIKRADSKIQFSNPFLFEIKSLYPKEYKVAQNIVKQIKEELGVEFPEGETGFIALHIHSAITDRKIRDLNRHHELIALMVELIEENLNITINKDDVNYNRLLQHLHRAIDRVNQDNLLGKEEYLKNVLKTTYPICYNLAWKLVKVMQKQLNKPISESEVLYLTIHLRRLTNKI